ncbi:universal stress protein [Neptunomonas phycophila]|jgi:universal stress protein A|uniref:Universal stress protein n=1 Tax=Neptunomonas phycophila TaxID=1572645 RepID=A0ABT9EPX2_9GAMM|nr:MULTISPECIES: universal stress protein [Neptunomonas]MBT3146211.1 universal stress protein [Neptunomonas phycophila]MDN2659613.1 universal stress protein [Neptunomonas sp. CHC150]MDO6466708.1 universal stress protein [Neptunomonas phycophila]MDO6783119.1 universal stress protein [Neptunomonas phycophila]MDP2521124.1 universal stress protein [Neptunomonas phycophila]
MGVYSNILLAVDLSDESDQLIEKTRAIARNNDATVTVLHVIEPLSFAYGGDVPMDLTTVQDQLNEHARTNLAAFTKKLDFPVADQMVLVGHTETEIHRIAEAKNCDLIVVGSHGRHGLALLLGSTANSVLHGAPCDVLAIRIEVTD